MKTDTSQQEKTVKTLSFRYKVDGKLFRRALYFNNFALHRGQSLIVSVLWVAAVAAMIYNAIMGIEVSNVTMMCYIVVAATVPLLVFSSELGYRRYLGSVGPNKMRTMELTPTWVKFKIQGEQGGDKLPWSKIAYAYELRDMFLIYRDAGLMVILPKSACAPEDLESIRACLREGLGRGFHERYKERTPKVALA